MRDFTLKKYQLLLETLQNQNFQFYTIRQSLANHPGKCILLRHDVDQRAGNSLITAQIEYDMGIKGTYYFRILPVSFDESIVREIESMGHEVGYHYEDLQLARQKTKDKRQRTSDCKLRIRQLVETKSRSRSESVTSRLQDKEEDMAAVAIESFRKNLAKLRRIVSVDTICMHGSPLSPIDSRILWKYYDYSSFGIVAEPYFDFALEDMLYLTDTGRRWDGSSVSIRDRVYIRDDGYYSGWKRKPQPGSAMLMTEKSDALQRQCRFRKTDNILQAISSGNLPERLMITFHPQRWNESTLPWLREYLWQNSKNAIKFLMVKNI